MKKKKKDFEYFNQNVLLWTIYLSAYIHCANLNDLDDWLVWNVKM